MKGDPDLWIQSMCSLSMVLAKSSRFQQAIELLAGVSDSLPDPTFQTWFEYRVLETLEEMHSAMGASVPGEERKLCDACTIFKKVLAMNAKEYGMNSLANRQKFTYRASLCISIPDCMELARNLIVETLDRLNKQELITGSELQNFAKCEGIDSFSILINQQDYDDVEVIRTKICLQYITELGEDNLNTILAKLIYGYFGIF